MLPASRPTSAPLARRAATALAVLTATASLAACAPQNEQTADLTGEEAAVQDVIQKLSDRADRDDASGICRELLGAELRRLLGDSDCPEKIQGAIDNADYTSLSVDTVKIDGAGTLAVAQIKPVESADDRRSVTLQRKDAKDQWRITALDPTGKTELPGTTPKGTTPTKTTPASTPES